MLDRKSYTREDLDHGNAAVDQQRAAYKALVTVIASATRAKNG
jgi:hypothetical protein